MTSMRAAIRKLVDTCQLMSIGVLLTAVFRVLFPDAKNTCTYLPTGTTNARYNQPTGDTTKQYSSDQSTNHRISSNLLRDVISCDWLIFLWLIGHCQSWSATGVVGWLVIRFAWLFDILSGHHHKLYLVVFQHLFLFPNIIWDGWLIHEMAHNHQPVCTVISSFLLYSRHARVLIDWCLVHMHSSTLVWLLFCCSFVLVGLFLSFLSLLLLSLSLLLVGVVLFCFCLSNLLFVSVSFSWVVLRRVVSTLLFFGVYSCRA